MALRAQPLLQFSISRTTTCRNPLGAPSGAPLPYGCLMAKENWIKGAIKKPGAFKAKAKKAGMSTGAYAKKVTKPGSKATASTKRQANLAKTLGRMRKK